MKEVLKGMLDFVLFLSALFVTFILTIIVSGFLSVSDSFNTYVSPQASNIIYGIVWLFSLAVSIHIFVKIRAMLFRNLKIHTGEPLKNMSVDNTEKIGRYIKQK